MVYTLYLTDPTDQSYLCVMTAEASSVEEAIAFLEEHNPGKIVSQDKPLIDPNDLKSQIVYAIQSMLDQTAQSRGYDNIISLCTYVASSIPKFKAEAQAGVNWRDACWGTCYQIMYDVEHGNRAVPSVEDILSEMPAMIWE